MADDGDEPMLFVHVVKARSLKPPGGKSSVKAVCALTVGEHEAVTHAYHGINAMWNEEFLFHVDLKYFRDVEEPVAFELTCWHKKLVGRDFLGTLTVPLSTLEDELRHERWYALTPRDEKDKDRVTGAVLLRFHYTFSSKLGLSPSLSEEWRSRYDALVDMLKEGNFFLVQALFDAVPTELVDQIVNASVHLLLPNNTVQQLIHVQIEREVARTQEGDVAGTLFRGFSPAAKMMIKWLHVFALRWTHAMLKEPLHKLISRAKPGDYDVEKDRAAALEHVKRATSAIIAGLQAGVRICPIELMKMNRKVVQEVEKRFPTFKYLALGNVLFLRWFCIALVSPHKYGLAATEPSDEMYAGLVMVSKVLQNVSTGGQFRQDHPLVELNEFVSSQTGVLQTWYKEISSEPRPGMVSAVAESVLPDTDVMLAAVLHTQVIKSKDKLLGVMADPTRKAQLLNVSDDAAAKVLKQLPELLNLLGDPPRGTPIKSHHVSFKECKKAGVIRLDAAN